MCNLAQEDGWQFGCVWCCSALIHIHGDAARQRDGHHCLHRRLGYSERMAEWYEEGTLERTGAGNISSLLVVRRDLLWQTHAGDAIWTRCRVYRSVSAPLVSSLRYGYPFYVSSAITFKNDWRASVSVKALVELLSMWIQEDLIKCRWGCCCFSWSHFPYNVVMVWRNAFNQHFKKVILGFFCLPCKIQILWINVCPLHVLLRAHYSTAEKTSSKP